MNKNGKRKIKGRKIIRYGYARVSTKEQDETRQVEALRNKGVQEIVIEKASGKNFIDRTEWQKLMAKIVVDDVIVVKSLDRLGRNNAEIKETFELLSKKQVYLEFLDNEILNTKKPTTEAEKLTQELLQPIVLHLLGYFAERERKLIKERQRITFKEFAKSFLYLLLTPPKIGYFNNANNNLIGNVTRSNNALKEIMIVCLFWLL